MAQLQQKIPPQNERIQSNQNIQYRNDFIAVYDQKFISYEHFVRHHLLQNTPCIITKVTTEWTIRKQWIDHKSNTIDYQYLSNQYGDTEVDVANCGKKSYSDQQRSKMKLKEYLQYLQSAKTDDDSKRDKEDSRIPHFHSVHVWNISKLLLAFAGFANSFV